MLNMDIETYKYYYVHHSKIITKILIGIVSYSFKLLKI